MHGGVGRCQTYWEKIKQMGRGFLALFFLLCSHWEIANYKWKVQSRKLTSFSLFFHFPLMDLLQSFNWLFPEFMFMPYILLCPSLSWFQKAKFRPWSCNQLCRAGSLYPHGLIYFRGTVVACKGPPALTPPLGQGRSFHLPSPLHRALCGEKERIWLLLSLERPSSHQEVWSLEIVCICLYCKSHILQ